MANNFSRYFPPVKEEPISSGPAPQLSSSESAKNAEASLRGGDSQDPNEKDWETVERSIESIGEVDGDTVHVPKPEVSPDLVEEGVKVEPANLADDDGVKVEKPKFGHSSGPQNTLGKDW